MPLSALLPWVSCNEHSLAIINICSFRYVPPGGSIMAYRVSQAIVPGTHIRPHHGPTNKKIRCHLPLLVPPFPDENVFHRILTEEERNGYDIRSEQRSCIRIHDEIIYFREGHCFVFDDSFEHEVYHPPHALGPRVVLIMDLWHPELTDQEVRRRTHTHHWRW